MSSSTTTIASKRSTMNNNDRKRSISSSATSMKRRDLSSTIPCRSERREIIFEQTNETNERRSRPKLVYRDRENTSSPSNVNQSLSMDEIRHAYATSTPFRSLSDSRKRMATDQHGYSECTSAEKGGSTIRDADFCHVFIRFVFSLR